MNSNNFGICQGRLTMPPNGELQWFPEQKWINEFKIAKNLGYDFIELLVEREHNQRNPIWTQKGIDEIKSYSRKYSLNLYSICLVHNKSLNIFWI